MHKINYAYLYNYVELFSVFRTQQLTQEDINEAVEYKVVFISPDANSWNSNCEDWNAMEEKILDYDGDIKQRDPPQQMELMQQDELFDFSALDTIEFYGNDYEKCVDALIFYAYVSNPQVRETMKNNTMKDWLILGDPICAQVAVMDANLYGNLLGLAL